MAELKTRENEASVDEFLNGVPDESVRADCRRLVELMSGAADAPPKMWGPGTVGFGSQRLRYESGRELDWMIVGFAPRKQNITVYLSSGEEWNRQLLAELGKYKVGKGCLHFKKLSDVSEKVLRQLIEESVRRAKK